jgi:hypothetical protein
MELIPKNILTIKLLCSPCDFSNIQKHNLKKFPPTSMFPLIEVSPLKFGKIIESDILNPKRLL